MNGFNNNLIELNVNIYLVLLLLVILVCYKQYKKKKHNINNNKFIKVIKKTFFSNILFINIINLFTTSSGFVFSVFILYITLPYFSGIQPFSIGELIIFFSNLDSSTKALTITSIITIIGLFLTVQKASSIRLHQNKHELQMLAMKDFEEKVEKTFNILTDLIYHIEISKKIKDSQENEGDAFFTFNESKISKLNIDLIKKTGELHGLLAKHNLILNTVLNGQKNIEQMIEEFKSIQLIIDNLKIKNLIFNEEINKKNIKNFIDENLERSLKEIYNHNGLAIVKYHIVFSQIRTEMIGLNKSVIFNQLKALPRLIKELKNL